MPGRELSQVDKALRGLRSLVMAGDVRPSERLSEVALSERLGISRTPLRAAMDRLIAEGLLERISTGGCRVASFSREDVEDAIELRGVIEGTAARLAAERGADPSRLSEAQSAADAIDAAILDAANLDFDVYVTENERYHRALSHMAGSPVLAREVDRVCRLPLASPSAFLGDQEIIPDFHASLLRAQRQHRAILDAIRAREGTRAEALAREHARLALRNLDFFANAGPRVAARVPGLHLLTTAPT